MDLLPQPSEETVEKIRNLLGVDEQRIKEAVKILSEWLKLQPHLPHQYEEARLERVFLRCKASVERTKEVIDMQFTLKKELPEFFCNTDPLEPWFTQASKAACFVPLPQLTKNYERVVIMTLLDPNPDNFIVEDLTKISAMITDIRIMEDYHTSEIFVLDCNNLTIGIGLKFTFPYLKKLNVAAKRAYKARLSAVHVINVPTFMDATLHFYSRIVSPKIASRYHTHRKGTNTLCNFISPEILPNEYGGTAGSLHDLWDGWQKKCYSYRSWFLEQEKLVADESKRPGKKFNPSELFGFEGSFRKLNVD